MLTGTPFTLLYVSGLTLRKGVLELSYSGCAWPTFQLFMVSAGAFFGYYVGGFDGFIRVLVAFVILDYVTALALAVKERKLSSDIGFVGIFKKILIFAVVAVANLIDMEIVYTGDMLRNAVVFFYLSNEGLSLLEKCAALDLPIPDGVRMALLNIRNNKQNDLSEVSIAVHDPSQSSMMSNATFEELTNGSGADDVHE